MILGSIIGLSGGIIQDIIAYYKEKKQRELDIKEWRQKAEFSFELDKQRAELGLSQIHGEIELEDAKKNRVEEENRAINYYANLESIKNESKWYNAITKASSYLSGEGLFVEIANFIIATTRPLISYLFLFFIWYIYKVQATNETECLDKFFMAVLLQMEVITSFWFYRRGSDRISPNFNNHLNLKIKKHYK